MFEVIQANTSQHLSIMFLLLNILMAIFAVSFDVFHSKQF